MALVMRNAVFLRPKIKLVVPRCNRVGHWNASVRDFSRGHDSSKSRDRGFAKTILGVIGGSLVTCGSVIYLLDVSLKASVPQAKPPSYPWSMDGLLSSLDHSSIRRGWHVYRTVCSTCHSLTAVRFQHLVDVSHTETEMKAIAAEYEVDDGPDDNGNYYKRPGNLRDNVPNPFPNEEAARAANNGAYPEDLSLIIKGRRDGKNYVFSLLTGYHEAPAGIELAEGQSFNPYFPGGAISMPEMVQDGVVDYDDGTPATRPQIAKDIVEFLTWTAHQTWDERKVTCTKGVGVCAILLALVAHMNRSAWMIMKSRKIFYVPRRK